MSDKKNLVCSKPFEWFEATERGSSYPVFLCCSGWLPVPAGDLKYKTPLEVWNSNAAKEIRRSVTDGSFRFCRKALCANLTDVSGPVHYVDDEELKELEAKIENPDLPTHLNCSYDRSCNLSCPTCRTELVMAKGKQREEIGKFGMDLINDLGENLEQIYITGSGDPFASKHYLEILTSGILTKYTDTEIYLHTNAQLFTEDTWKKLKLGKNRIQVLEVSIDAASKLTYAENRKPGNWEVLNQNMTFLSTLKKLDLIERFQISFVVQTNNFREMTDFIKLGKTWSVDAVYFSIINNWGTFTDMEYSTRAIHKKSHPEHELLLEELRKIDVSDPIVRLGGPFLEMAK